MRAGLILETRRLALVRWDPGDLDWLCRLHADPAVQRFIERGGKPAPRDVLARKLDWWIEHERRHGFTKWKVVERDGGAPVGRAGLELLPEMGAAELGFTFARQVWGRGYATEVAHALVAWAWASTALAEILGIAHVGNAASRRVLEKLGMRERERRPYHGMPFVFYALPRPAEAPRAADIIPGR
ncbi:MAG TPA: GNAT family N-acetyltransferase [Gaiellales bacterium]|nr:GNAT family N-acetyltransferase [Gaiellales bacterium]